MAEILDKHHQEQEALHAYGRTVAYSGGNPSAIGSQPTVLFRFGELSEKFGYTDQAKDAFVRAIEHSWAQPPPELPSLKPDLSNPSEVRRLAEAALAFRAEKTHDSDQADRMMRRAVKDLPDSATAHACLAWLLLQRHQFEESLHNCAVAAKLRPDKRLAEGIAIIRGNAKSSYDKLHHPQIVGSVVLR